MDLRRTFAALMLVLAVSCSKVESPADATTAHDEAVPAAEGAEARSSEPAVAAASVRKPCSFVNDVDLQAVAGPDAKCEDVTAEQARLGTPNFAEYEMVVKASAEREITNAKSADKTLQPLAGVGDEAWITADETTAYIRKGARFARVSSSAVVPGAPKSYKEGVRFLAERIATKL